MKSDNENPEIFELDMIYKDTSKHLCECDALGSTTTITMLAHGVPLQEGAYQDRQDPSNNENEIILNTNPNNIVLDDSIEAWRLKRYFLLIPFLLALTWAIFLYYPVSKRQHLSLSSYSPISPADDVWWFLTVGYWPLCSNLKPEYWRLISMQFVHAGLPHIGKGI